MSVMNKQILFLLSLAFFAFIGTIEAFQTSGTLHPSADSKLCSQKAGRVESVLVDVGDAVKKGEALVKLESSLLTIDVAHKKALLDSSQIELKDAETNYLRMQKLWQKPVGELPSISQKRFEEAQLRYAQAEAQVRQAQETLKRAEADLEEATIKAPFDGIISARFVDPGTTTSTPDKPLLEILAIDPLYLEFSVPQTFLKSIQPGMPIVFHVDGIESSQFDAKIWRVFPSVDISTRAVTCRALIENSQSAFKPGSLVKVEIKSNGNP